ncbi:hypothetical protein CH282_01680 [Rhodococcus sp. 06-418-1B]|nr:hypothetical protein CH282_01680 [Rhodococcus sp. 06-418-1B]
MAALTPTWMFENWPTFMPALLDPDVSPPLPDDVHLMMAYSRGQTGRLEGFSTTIINPRHEPLISYASVYFAPLAWQLVASNNVRSMQRSGWAEVSNWLNFPVEESHDLRQLVQSMAATAHPLHDPRHRHSAYAHMASDETSVLVETFDVLGGNHKGTAELQMHLQEQVFLPLPEDGNLTPEWILANTATRRR